MLDRATVAVLALEAQPGDPWAALLHRFRRAHGVASDERAILEQWKRAHPGSMVGAMRYRWPLTHKFVLPLPAWAGTAKEWTPWRPAEREIATNPFEFESRLSVPAITLECAEMLAESDAPDAPALLEEAEPVIRRELALFVQAAHAWADTFALWCLVRRPRTLARFHPFGFAIATAYAAGARKDGAVAGSRFPFHEKPLVSATAQLATGLLALGQEIPLIARLVSFVAAQRDPSGGWGDAGGPPEAMTTLVAAHLLTHVDPTFALDDAFLASKQSPDGLFRAFGPEAPWLTAEVVSLLESGRLPFAERFRFPHVPAVDHKTGLPFFAYFSDLARLFESLPGLASSSLEMAFVDLAGFRLFNNTFGQDKGDEVLRAFADHLSSLSAARVVRDGGDEFLIVGAPTRTNLARDLDAARHAWPDIFRARFGDVPPVASRILVTRTLGKDLSATREKLGRAISTLKDTKPGPEGVRREI